MKISKIILYDEPTIPEIQLDRLGKFLTETFPIKIETRKNFFSNLDDKTYEKIASIKILDIKKPFQKHDPSVKDVLTEKENTYMSKIEEMPLYDGIEFQKIISESIPKNENRSDILNVIFTNKLICTFDESDFRYHARVIIGSNPTIISTTGIVEAPAKPKQYYLDLITNGSKERIDEIKKKYSGKFLEYHDLRMSEIVEGYLLQSIFYYETGDVFCTDKNCRLFNAHWQEELIYTQLENRKLCNKHEEILKVLKNQL
ncbi:hypothetical protein C5F50_04885 [Nitrosopumilus ureiphilus]|uniref:Uncharacterized protein n=1 Tax=Nitrosopumilus ureiphilus TaxID=1470067 RepID=A0A7D5RCJ3_9ARCH|nr:DUF6775 family putative metallopeptidase [Nitrosopumilus ureiphilus]QLH07922.1 hypothetical protein C5F50_04885 [Nitrosopumilus ureiphilus]